MDMQMTMQQLMDQQKPFSFTPNENPLMQEYIRFYGLDFPQVEHLYGYIPCCNEQIFLQSFRPVESRGTVLLLHGYLEHAGVLKHVIFFLLEHSYQVITFDWQGHGLSSGERASVSQFAEYLCVFEQIYKEIIPSLTDSRIHVIAHSTGGAVALDYMLNHSSDFDRVVLLAPLVRSYMWHASKIGFYLGHRWIKEVQRVNRHTHEEYANFIQMDPLQNDKVPLTWVQALFDWYKEVQSATPSNRELLIIQGNQDKTVDWKYNIRFFQEKFPESRIEIVKGGGHQLFNDTQSTIEQTLDFIHDYLK
ncbi:alpha/beta hydrolase [Hazenella coriacea]|nr:alpha/beta hydrolase [Hazenella coriacea]